MLFFIDSVGLVGSGVIAGVVPGVAGIGVGSVIVGAVGVVVVINVNVDELHPYSVCVITIDGVYVTVQTPSILLIPG